jgi:uncharacterized iron-regulated membrane protein
MLLMAVTGAALVFRGELAQMLHPTLYPRAERGAAQASIVDVIRSINTAFPGQRIGSVFAPTADRPVFQAFVEQNSRFRAVLVSPSGEVLGERPETGFVRWLQLFHVNLFAGNAGRVANGVGAAFLLVLCATGLVIWWPGLDGWRRGLRVDFRRSWRRITWELHGAVGFWTVLLLAMWALTGAYLAYPQPFRMVIHRLSPLTTPASAQSESANGRTPVVIAPLVARALESVPGGQLAGVVLPASERAPVVVQVARERPDDVDRTGYVHFTFDQYTGELLNTWDQDNGSLGDLAIAWIQPLHYGSFGGFPLKLAWALLGLAPAVLFATGAVMWWNRVLRRKWAQLNAA